jgi:hypothetical protein
MPRDPSYANELAKEYLRDRFHAGTLDVTSSFEHVRGFCQIFAGEMEALIAIDHARFLTTDEKKRLIDVAAPTKETLTHYRAWLNRALA